MKRCCISLCGVALLVCIFARAGAALEPESFQTPEYKRSTGLDFIRAADAYALGYTGRGVTLGIIDYAVRLDHPELAGKVLSQWYSTISDGGLYPPDFTKDTHGSHVAGIMAAWRNGQGMHGTAFDAELRVVQLLGQGMLDPPDVYAGFSTYPEVRIINNSWGYEDDSYFLMGTVRDAQDDAIALAVNNPTVVQLLQLTENYPDKVLVFAAGNEGQASTPVPVLMPRYNHDFTNLVSVGSLDIGAISKDARGVLHVAPGGVSVFSNLAQGSELWTVMAPGSVIFSLNAADNGYMFQNGTSMAAPYVSGALGLVQQAFPWMTGKQLADAVLTTANNGFVAPDYTVQASIASGRVKTLYIRSIDGGITTQPSNADAKELIRLAVQGTAYANIISSGYLALVDSGHWEFEQVTREQVFGQGLLDVGRAVRGIARLDANRMVAEDVFTLAELGGRKDALESFDTKGWNAVFSNDITQRQWDDRYHHPDFQTTGQTDDSEHARALNGLNAGLRKLGAGRLTLTGDNSYAGATVIEGGTLSVSKRPDGSGGWLRASDVLVRPGGTLQGNGTIACLVTNSGTVAPGNSIGTLTVGSYTQTPDGRLLIEFDGGGRADQLVVTGNANLGGKLELAPQPGYYNGPLTMFPLHVAGLRTGNFSAANTVPVSPTLTMRVADSGASYTVTSSRAPLAYSRYAENGSAWNLGLALPGVASRAWGDMRNLFASLDFSSPDGSTVRQALNQLGAGAYESTMRASQNAQRNLDMLLLRRMVANRGAERMENGRWQAFVTPFGGFGSQSPHNGWGHRTQGAGVLAGLEKGWDTGLNVGLHAAFSARRTDGRGDSDARTLTHGLNLGGQTLFSPDAWNNAYILGELSLGLEDNDMRRRVHFNGFARDNSSQWTGLTAGGLLGGGKDFTWGPLSGGPLAWLEYSLTSLPGIREDGGGATRLKVDGTNASALRSALGLHGTVRTNLNPRFDLSIDFLAAWQHDLLSGGFRTVATFRDYGEYGFRTRHEPGGRDSLLARLGCRVTFDKDFFIQAEAGTELFRRHYSSFTGSLGLGMTF